jgi:hypothetical protein
VRPWLPTSLSPLLGIGAKEQEVYDDGGGGKGKKGVAGAAVRPEKRYVPLVKVKVEVHEVSEKESRRVEERA